MNKSLALKNKLYLFLSLVFSFLFFLYLLYFLINGERGIISYYKIKNQQNKYQLQLNKMNKQNDSFNDSILRLKPNTIDLDYLDEQLRNKTGFVLENEIIIIIDE